MTELQIAERQKQTKPTFDTIREQRGMHCMWIEIHQKKNELKKS